MIITWSYFSLDLKCFRVLYNIIPRVPSCTKHQIKNRTKKKNSLNYSILIKPQSLATKSVLFYIPYNGPNLTFGEGSLGKYFFKLQWHKVKSFEHLIFFKTTEIQLKSMQCRNFSQRVSEPSLTHQLHLSRRVRPSPNECPVYD